jgi:hypothetical protein
MRTLELVLVGAALAVSVAACGSSAGDDKADQNGAGAGAGGGVSPGAPNGGGGNGNAPVTPGKQNGTGAAVAVGGAGTVPASSAGGSSGPTPPGGGGATNPASAGGTNGAAGGPPSADLPGTVTLNTDSFQLQPGQEIYKCQNFDNPFGGKDTAIQRIVTDMATGSHHLHVYNLTEGTSRTLEDCDISDFHALVHAAGSPHAETDYPAGMATKIRGNTGLRIQLHYLNTGADVKTVKATLKLSPVDASTVTKWVAQLYLNRVVLSVPPGAGQKVTTTCSIPATYGGIGLVGGGSHMHMRGVHFVATTNTGVSLADTTEWNEPPPLSYTPPVMMNPGDSVTWTCTYDNETGQTLSFGPSASKNEMCIYLARYYSSSADDTQLECQAVSQIGGAAAPRTN